MDSGSVNPMIGSLPPKIPLTDKPLTVEDSKKPDVDELQSKLQKLNFDNRKKELSEFAKHLLDQKPEITTTLKQFAFLHCSAFLKDTPMEGGQPLKMIEYWLSLVEFWENNQSIIKPHISKEQLHLFKTHLQDLKDFSELTDPVKIQELMIKKLNEKGSCYFPTSWAGFPGHFMIGRFTLKDDKVVVDLMTKGAGAEFHEYLTAGPNKFKVDYAFDPVLFDKEKIFDLEKGKSFFNRLAKLQVLPGKLRELDSPDVYVLFCLEGKVQQKAKKASTLAVTTQRSGTCPETGLHMVLYESDPLFPKRNMFAAKFQSLVDGYRQFKNQLDQPDVRYYLHEAALEQMTRISKQHPDVITDKEFLLVYAVVQDILDATNKAKQQAIQGIKINTPSIQGNVSSSSFANPPQTYSMSEAGGAAAKQEVMANQLFSERKLEKASDCLEFLKEINKSYVKQENSLSQFESLHQVFSKFPFPTGQAIDPFWDGLNPAGSKELLYYLMKFVMISHEACKDGKQKGIDPLRLYEIRLRAYDIAAQVAPKIDSLNMKGYHLDYVEMAPDFCNNAEVAETLARVKSNFAKREIASTLTLFPKEIIDPKTDPFVKYLKNFLNDQKRSEIMNSGTRPLSLEEGMIRQFNRGIYPEELTNLWYLRAMSEYLNPARLNRLEIKNDAGNKELFLSYDPDDYQNRTRFKLYLNKPGYDSDESNEKLTAGFGSQYDHYSKFGCKENLILCSSPQEVSNVENAPLPLSTETMEELAILSASSNLRVIDVLSWASANVHLMSHKLVQGYLENILYKTGDVRKSLLDSFSPTLQRIHSFLKNGFTQFSNLEADIDTLLWLTQLGTFLESCVLKHTEYTGTKKQFPNYFSILRPHLDRPEFIQKSSDRRVEILQNMLKIYDNLESSQLSEEDCKNILFCKMKLEMIGFEVQQKEYPVFTQAIHAFVKHIKQIETKINEMSEKERNEFFNDFLNKMTGNSKKYEWVKINDQWQNAEYSIDLKNASIHWKGEKLQEISSKIIQNENYKTVFGNQVHQFMPKGDIFYLLPPKDNYRLFFNKESQELQIQQKIKFQGKEDWYEYVTTTQPYHRYPVTKSFAQLPDPLKNEKLTHWVQVDVKNPEMIIQDKTDSRNVFHYTNSGVKKIDSTTGELLNLQLMDIYSEKVDPVSQKWKEFVSNIQPSGSVEIYVEKAALDNFLVQQIKFSHLNDLSFSRQIVNNEPRMQWDKNPDFYLANNQHAKLLNGIKGAILLETADGKSKKILIPINKLAYTGSNPTSLVNIDPSNPIEVQGKKYFEYDVSSDETELKSESPRAALYLSLVYRGLREYEQAMKYLKQSYKFENDTIDDLNIIEGLISTDKFPEVCAFDCHLTLRVAEHHKKHTKRSFEKPTEEFERKYKRLIENLRHQYPAYKERFSEFKEGISSIPQFLVLSKSEEAFFQNINHEVLTIPRAEVAISYLTQPLTDDNKNALAIAHMTSQYSGRDLPNDFVRMDSSEHFLKKEFLNIFRKIKFASPGELDKLKLFLFYLHRSSNLNTPITDRIIAILFSAIESPNAYADIYISNDRYTEDITKLEKAFEKYIKDTGKTQFFLINFNPSELTHVKMKLDESIVPAQKTDIPFRLNPLADQVKWLNHPLQDAAKILITDGKEVPLVQGPFPLKALNIESEEKLVKRQFADLEAGHELNVQKKIKYYVLNNNWDELKETVQTTKDADNESAKKLKNEILELANVSLGQRNDQLSPEDLKLHLKYMAKKPGAQNKKILLEDLIAAFMKKDLNSVLAMNPALKVEDVQKIFDQLLELFIVSSRVNQSQDALNILANIAKSDSANEKSALSQQLAGLLDGQRQYNVNEHPEFVVYEFASGMLLRKDQVELLQWIFKNIDKPDVANMLFQFPAGGGKTKVLLPILAFHIASKGKLPVALNITALYDIGKGDLEKSLIRAYQQNLEVIEIDLETQVSDSKLRTILDDLENWQANKKCLAMKTDTWHALKLKYQLALDEKNEVQVDLYDKIIKFIQSNGISLIDEGHQSENPLHESNIACGKSKEISPQEQKAIYLILQMLFGEKYGVSIPQADGSSKPVQDIVRLQSNKQALLSDNDLKSIQSALIPFIVKDPLLDELKEYPVQSYLETIDSPKPQWLKNLHESNPDLASMVDLIKKYLYEISPHTLRLIQSIDYGDAIDARDLTTAPRHNKQPVTSKFQDIYITLALTIQNTYQQGLNGPKITLILQKLLEEHYQQKKADVNSNMNTKAQQLFNLWWGQGEPPPPFLEHVYLDNKKQMETIANRMGRHKDVLQEYLFRFVLPQIKVYNEKMSSTPPYLLDGFVKNIIFSATPGIMELYPIGLRKVENKNEKGEIESNHQLDLGFEALVLSTLCEPQNRNLKAISTNNLAETFQQLDEAFPQLMSSLCTVIDQGAVFRAFDNATVIRELIKYARSRGIPFNGGIYRKENNDALASETGQLMLSTSESEPDVSLRGSDLKDSLKKIGKNFDQVLLATLFDRAITTGADILQPLNAKGLLSVGERTTKTNILQAAMRLRKLLLGKNGQSLMWVVEKELEQLIKTQVGKKDQELSVEDIFLWMIRNEAKLIEKAVVMRAYQGIQHLVRKIAWDRINSPNLNVEQKIKLYHEKFRKGLVDKVVTDPYETFGNKTAMEDTDKALAAYALACAKDLGFDKDFLDLMPKKDQEDYLLIIDQTKKLVDQLNVSNAQMSQEMHQKQEALQESVQEQTSLQEVTNVEKKPMHFNEDYSYWLNIAGPNFLTPKFIKDKSNDHFVLAEVLNLPMIPSDILVSNAFLKIESDQKETKLRQIQYILVVQDGNENPKYLLCSRKGADYYKQSLLVSEPGKAKDRKVMLMDIEGRLVQNGKAMPFDKESRKKLQKSDEFKDRLAILQLLNGKVRHLERMKRIAQEHWTKDDFDNIVKKIQQIQYGRSKIDIQAINKIRDFRIAKKVVDISDSYIKETMLQRLLHFIFPTRQLQPSVKPKPIVNVSPAPSQSKGWFGWFKSG